MMRRLRLIFLMLLVALLPACEAALGAGGIAYYYSTIHPPEPPESVFRAPDYATAEARPVLVPRSEPLNLVNANRARPQYFEQVPPGNRNNGQNGTVSEHVSPAPPDQHLPTSGEARACLPDEFDTNPSGCVPSFDATQPDGPRSLNVPSSGASAGDQPMNENTDQEVGWFSYMMDDVRGFFDSVKAFVHRQTG